MAPQERANYRCKRCVLPFTDVEWQVQSNRYRGLCEVDLLEQHRALKSWRLKLIRRSAGRHSEIFEYRAAERPYPVVVKRILDSIKPENARAAVLREFESLQTVRRHLPPQLSATVPQPLMVLPDARALVLQALAGRPLSAVLKREANCFVGLLRKRRVGTWPVDG
jgi:hypothetical protein